jgi:hypothetical protein
MNINLRRFQLFILVLVLGMLCSGCSLLGEAIPSDSYSDEQSDWEPVYSDETATENGLTNEIIAYDDGTLTISITGLEFVQNSLVSTMQVCLSNRSSDEYIPINLTGFSVDGVQFRDIPELDSGFVKGCHANTTEECEIKISNYPDNDTFFQRFEFNDIELTFEVLRDDAKTSSSVHVYPHGQTAKGIYQLQTKDDLTVLLDNPNVKITMVRCHKTETYDSGFIAQLYVENKMESVLNLYPSAASLNGITLYPENCGILIEPYKSIVWDILWSDETVRGHGIDSIDTVSLDLVFTEYADQSSEPFLYETITFVPMINNYGL